MPSEYTKGSLNKKNPEINDSNQGVEVAAVTYLCLHECATM